MIRRAVPFALLPLALVACGLASSPWLRVFPSSTIAVPIFGAALLSILTPVVVTGIGLRKLWLTALIDLVMLVFYLQLVVLHELGHVTDLWSGLVHGPAEILSFALPLVTPRALLVAPVVLCWIGGAALGETIGRSWHSVVPYAMLLVTFGLAYAGSARGITSETVARRTDVLLAGGLLLTILLLRACQAWVEQDLDSEASQPDGLLPLRGLATGAALSVVVALAAGSVTAGAFSGPPVQPVRTPPLNQGRPLSPVPFIAALRPSAPDSRGTPVFQVDVDRPTSGYIAIADTDLYDGDAWSFDRTFRPSGGTVPADSDPTLRAPGPAVTQTYTIDRGALTSAPWMPFLYRPDQVSGVGVDVDTASGMIVPSSDLHAGSRYEVRSSATVTTFDRLGSAAVIASSTPPSYLSVPSDVSQSLGTVVTSFENETHTRSTDQVAFLQALARDLRANYALVGGSAASSTASPTASPSPTVAPASHASSTPHLSPTPRATGSAARRSAGAAAHSSSHARTPVRHTSAPRTTATPTPSASSATPASGGGGVGFANVLASILGPTRTATPEQYATLVALVARQIGVPARLVTGFRVATPGTSATMAAGNHVVTTAEAWTWVEIPVQGQGWVVLDPSPGTYGAQRPPPTATAGASATPTPTLTPNGLVTQSNGGGHAVAPRSTIPHSHAITAAGLALIVAAIVVAFVLVLLALLLLRKVLRLRRRQRSGDPRERLIGAWRESLDVLQEAGLPDLSTLTSAEVAARTGEQFGGETGAQARYIGDRANAAIFSPTSWVSAEEADAAWHAQGVLRRSVHRRLSVPARVGSRLRFHRDPRARSLAGPASWSDTRTPDRPRRQAGRRRAH